MPSVKIAIDIRRMTEFGVGTYIRNVVRTLGRLDHETTYFLIGSPAKSQGNRRRCRLTSTPFPWPSRSDR